MTERTTVPWTDAESKFINENFKGRLYAKTLLSIAREDGVSLDEALRIAKEQPDQEEHYKPYEDAANFIERHNSIFGLKLKKDS